MNPKHDDSGPRRLAHVALVGVLAMATTGLGCGEEPEGEGGLGVSPTAGSPPEPEGPCYDAGRTCECEGLGYIGTNVCEDDELICECPECADLQTPPGFTACGGDVWGAWRLLETRGGAGALHFQDTFGGTTECVADFQRGGRHELAIELREGGGALVVADEHYAETVVFSRQCASATCRNTSFTGFSPFEDSSFGNDVQCEEHECDMCTCTSQVSNDGVDRTSWSFEGSQLRIGGGQTSRFSYCATDNQLILQGPSIVYVFEAVEVAGIPTSCAERSPGLCELGVGCDLGICVGESEDCEGVSENNCSTYPGCAWDSSVCTGEAPVECTLERAEVTPGCQLEPL